MQKKIRKSILKEWKVRRMLTYKIVVKSTCNTTETAEQAIHHYIVKRDTQAKYWFCQICVIFIWRFVWTFMDPSVYKYYHVYTS